MNFINTLFPKKETSCFTYESYPFLFTKNQVFQLPIETVRKHSIPLHVATDVELITNNNKTMYSTVLQAKSCFGKGIQQYLLHDVYTDDVSFLRESQDILRELVKTQHSNDSMKYIHSSTFVANGQVWKSDFSESAFLEDYTYLEWNVLKEYNTNEPFLQAWSVLSMASPFFSLIFPIILLFLPFIILQWRGAGITVESYVAIIQQLIKNHFFGKLLSIRTFDAKTILSLLFYLAFYLFSIYQNINQCIHQYERMKEIREYLHHLSIIIAEYRKSSAIISQIYRTTNTKIHISWNESLTERIVPLLDSWNDLQEFSHESTNVISEWIHFGKMKRLYYEIHILHSDTIRAMFGWLGWYEIMCSLAGSVQGGKMAFCTFVSESESESNKNPVLVDAYYPPLQHSMDVVKNTVDLSDNVILSGCNASGKTTILKTTLLNIIFSQQFGCGYYSSATFPQLYTHIHSYLNIPDTSNRDSLFQAESRRCKEILDIVSVAEVDNIHFCIFDELYSGTNHDDAVKSSISFLKYLSKYTNVHFMLTTHCKEVCEYFSDKKGNRHLQNYQMRIEENDDEKGGITFTYEMIEGISVKQGAYHILSNLDYPKEITDEL